MLFKKYFKEIIDIDNINEIYNLSYNSLDEYILNQIKKVFEKKCYKNSFIVSIEKIIQRSYIKCNGLELNNSLYYVSVEFEATILQFSSNEIINDVTVTDVNKSVISGYKDNILIYLKYNNKLNYIKKGDIMPIITGVSSYPIYKSNIMVSAFPFKKNLLETKIIYYKINKLSDNDKDLLNNGIIKQINDELETKKNKRFEYFKNLLYPNTIETNLLNLNIDNTIIYKNKHTMFSDIKVKNYINESALNIYTIFLNEYLTYLIKLNEMSIIYDDDKIFKDNEHIFKNY